jgi:hypothetical protein
VGGAEGDVDLTGSKGTLMMAFAVLRMMLGLEGAALTME